MLDIEEYPKKLLEELCIVFDEGKKKPTQI